ncbi:Fic family protein [Candidatus Thioglobus sp.]|uniref:Fic family protein n=1 Tax=Candidatus Thioglobus sp. TaxID=2026721 RepID=UPI003D0FAB39
MPIDLTNSVLYHSGKFPPKQLDYNSIIAPLTGATNALSRYDQMLKNLHNSAILSAPLRNQEAVLTSRMEGTISTLDEILQYEAENLDSDKDSTRSDIIETLLYQRALNKTQKSMEEGRPLSPFLLRSAHQVLLSFGRGFDKNPGQFKIEQNYLSDKSKKNILFTPVSPEHLQSGLDELFSYIVSNPEIALIKVAVAHIEFEALHPFKDGNGRIGRMLITLMLWSLGLISEPHFYMSHYLEENKDLYIDTMRNVSKNNDWSAWCVFFLTAVEKQAVRNLEVAEQITTLYEEMKEPFSQVLSSKWSIKVLDFVFTNPIFKNNGLSKKCSIPPQSAARFTKELLKADLIKTVIKPSGRRGTMYSFEPLLELVRV